MSESVRSPQVVAVEFAPFPLDREENREIRSETAPRGLFLLKLTRLFFWILASARQRFFLVLRPVISALTGMETFWLSIGERLWRFFYSAGVLASDAAWLLRVTAGKLVGHAGTIWYEFSSRWGRWVYRRATMVSLFSCACLCLIVSSFYAVGLEVFVNGESIGFVSSLAEFSQTMDDVSERASEILKYPYYPNPDVTYHYALVDRTSIFNRTDTEDLLFSQIADIKKLFVLTVDGTSVAVTSDREGLQSIMDDLLAARNMEGQASSVSFVQEVLITHQWTDAKLERPLDHIADLLSSSTEARYESYNPQDTFADIARLNGMSEEDLLALNRGVMNPGNPEEHPPEKLLVQKALPFLSVETRLFAQFEEEIPYTSVTVPDDEIYEGISEVRVTGKNGVALVSVERCFIDGDETESIELERETTLEPVQEVIAEGTKKRPPKYPTGTFIRPYWGRFTSGFGRRSLFGGSMHTGIDLAGPIGDPIVASDGGWVTFAGTKNGYGKCVIISHGDGLSTLYGHCSKLLVTEGQAVAQGELIAKVGNTGRSTGPHLHFEIRVNGTAVNPMGYLD